ncbi:transposase [Kitasatospora sp. NPDC094028]
MIDAQSLRAAATVSAASRGYDGAKQVPGRKRHIVVDCLGLLPAVWSWHERQEFTRNHQARYRDRLRLAA